MLNRMKQKGQQIQREKNAGKMLLAMPKVVFEMIPLRLEYMDVFVVYLPATTTYFDQVGNIF